MAKYCKYCGKEIKGEKKCDCQKEIVKTDPKELEKAKETIKKEVSNTSKKYMNQIGNIIKNTFVNSKETTENFLKNENFTLTGILLLLSSLVISICTISFLKGIYTNLNYYWDNLNTAYQWASINQVWHFSYFKILICVFIGLLLGELLLAVIFNLGFEKICQSKITFKKTLATIAISITEPTLIGILSAFLTIFSYKLSFILVFYAILLFVINLYESFKISGDISSTHYNRLFTVLIIIFCFLAIYLIPNLFI